MLGTKILLIFYLNISPAYFTLPSTLSFLTFQSTFGQLLNGTSDEVIVFFIDSIWHNIILLQVTHAFHLLFLLTIAR